MDQFEELYPLCQDLAERDQFIDRLLTATNPASRLRVVIAVRADFLDRCAEHPALTAALQDGTVLAGPMSRNELRQAIVRPAQAAGLIVERSLTARILDEVEGEPGALPLMSHALLETWRRRKGRALTLEAHESVGGLHGAIARTAESVHAGLTPRQAALARRILLRLITPGAGTPDTRRPARCDEFTFGDAADTGTVLDRLARARLITLDEGMVDIAHEALITAWPRLRGWLETERGRLRVHRQLTEAAATWRSLHEDAGVLYRGSRLTTVEEAFPEHDRSGFLTETEESFLRASIEARHKEVAGVRLPVASVPPLPFRVVRLSRGEQSKSVQGARVAVKRKAWGFIAAGVAAAAAVLAGASTASAYGPSYCNSSTCDLSISPSTGGIYFEMPRYTGVSMICWTDNQWYDGTNRWFKVNTAYGQGYMIANQVSNQTSVGHC